MDFLENEIEEILNIFREESEEQIQKINKNLLKLEANPKDQTAISELFREAHSLKGAARMIGLNDIQLIAHKLEDVLGLAKDRLIKITPELVDTLCKAVDCINSIVEESIATRGQASFPQVPAMVKELEKIVRTDNKDIESDFKEEITEIPGQKEGQEIKDANINKECKILTSQIKVSIEKIKIFSSDHDTIEEFLNYVLRLEPLISTLNNYELSELIQDIKAKLETSLKGSGIITSAEISEIEENFDIFNSIFEKLTDPRPVQEFPESEFEDSLSIETSKDIKDYTEDFDFIKNNLDAFSFYSPENLSLASEIIEKLNNIKEVIDDKNYKDIVEKITEMLVFSREKTLNINKDIIVVLKESFESVILKLNYPDETYESPTLVLQRLAVLFQMIKLSSNETINDKPEEYQDFSNGESNLKLSPAVKGTGILNKDAGVDVEVKSSYEVKPSNSSTIKTLRVDTKKLDQLVNQVGELIIAKIKAKEHLSELEKMIRSVEEWNREWNKNKQYFKHVDKPFKSSDLPGGTSIYTQSRNINSVFDENAVMLAGLLNKLNHLHKIIQEDDARLNLIVNELEEKIKSVRVLPLATIFHMFPRMVRDIAREKNKNIELIISGSETSVDKKIIEEIKSPLIHIIRNSIDHGIEDSQTRITNGKNPVGKIFIAAYHLENSVLIEIIDDGRGINIESIKNKVLNKNLLTKEELESMTEEQIMNIIFWPGFSTGETVTDISGRGIGLDIVYTKISQLNGLVKIKSTLGEGCKVSIQLPVTMATIKSFLVEVNNQKFAIPTSTIKTTLLITQENIFFKEGKKTILVGDTTVPICNLSDALDMTHMSKKNNKIVVIVVQSEDVKVGFIVDRLLGDQEILHKNLSAPLLRVKNIAGITTLGSGDLCLILNIGDLVKSAYSKFGMTSKRLIEEINSEQWERQEKHILVVDDSLTTRILERNILKAAGYKVTVANNGLEALTKVVSEHFDLIISDVEMPEINGFELTERLRELNNFKNIPIILVTSLASENDRRKGLGLGANAYLTKGDFNQEELLKNVKQLLQ